MANWRYQQRESTSVYLFKYAIFKLDELYTYSVAIFMFIFYHGKLPPFFGTLFRGNDSVHQHSTRQTNQFHTPI